MTIADDAPPYPDDIVPLLVLEAGRIMEDSSPFFALLLPAASPARTKVLAQLISATGTVHALMNAAVALEHYTTSLNGTGRTL